MAATPEPRPAPIPSNHARRSKVLTFVPHEPSIVLSQQEAVQFLLRSAVEYEVTFCVDPGCVVCHEFILTWESVYASLSPAYRVVVDAKLDTGSVLRPEAPKDAS